MKKKIFFIPLIIFFINIFSCSKQIEQNSVQIQKSNFNLLEWDSTIEKIALEICENNNRFISNKTLFFIDFLENKTNIFIDTEKLTDSIKNKISTKNNKINFIKTKDIEKNKEKLGISKKNKTLDISTAILFCRNNNIEYYLYSCISGDNEPFLLTIKLILVKTGEIIFMKKEKFHW